MTNPPIPIASPKLIYPSAQELLVHLVFANLVTPRPGAQMVTQSNRSLITLLPATSVLYKLTSVPVFLGLMPQVVPQPVPVTVVPNVSLPKTFPTVPPRVIREPADVMVQTHLTVV